MSLRGFLSPCVRLARNASSTHRKCISRSAPHLQAATSSQHTWANHVPGLRIPDDVDLARYTINHMGHHGNKPAIVDGQTGQTVTYAQLQTQVVRVASALIKLGIRPHDVVALMLPNCLEYPAIFLAVTAIGATVSPLNPVYTTGELHHVMKQSHTKVVVTTPELLPVVRPATSGCPDFMEVLTVGAAEGCRPYSSLAQDDGSAFPDNLDVAVREHVASLPFSSGTTGMPKGVMLSHYNLVANMEQMTEASVADCVGSAGSILGVLPFFHIYGLMVILFAHLKRGATITSIPKFEPELFLKCIQDSKADFLHLAPPLVLFLAKHPLVDKYDLSSVRGILSAAAPVGVEVCEEVMARLPNTTIHQGYGMTESSPLTHVCPKDKPKLASIGKLVPQTEGKVIDLNTGESLAPFKEGELCTRGPQVMLGYHNNQEATAQTVDEQGWLHSGDIGYVDDEGYFYVTDRLKELIKVKGFQVAPAELEAVLVSHPAISDAAVVGVADERAGELPRAFVVKKPEKECSDAELAAFVEERVAPYKKLAGGIRFIEAIPKTASGKILRRQLKD